MTGIGETVVNEFYIFNQFEKKKKTNSSKNAYLCICHVVGEINLGNCILEVLLTCHFGQRKFENKNANLYKMSMIPTYSN
jgi:hypothetical protein